MPTNKHQFQIPKFISIGLFVLICTYLYLFGALSPVCAQSVVPLIVAPARQSITGDPGKSVNFSVRFYNTSEEPITGTFKAADFIVSDNIGTPQFLEGPTILSDKFAAAKWTTLSLEKGTITGSGMVTVNGTVKLPTDAAPGGKYFAVFFEPDTTLPAASGEKQQEAALVSTRIAGLVYLRVAGPIAENASIIKFSAPDFSEYGPVTITTEIKNGGSYHISPVGQITVKNMFGREISRTKVEGFNVFPDASRLIEAKVGEKWMVGRFSANLDLSYGESGKALASTLYFWVFPWKLAAIITLGIIILILVLIMITGKFTKKQKELEEELIEEKTELEKLKEKYQDMVNSGFGSSDNSDSNTPKNIT